MYNLTIVNIDRCIKMSFGFPLTQHLVCWNAQCSGWAAQQPHERARSTGATGLVVNVRSTFHFEWGDRAWQKLCVHAENPPKAQTKHRSMSLVFQDPIWEGLTLNSWKRRDSYGVDSATVEVHCWAPLNPLMLEIDAQSSVHLSMQLDTIMKCCKEMEGHVFCLAMFVCGGRWGGKYRPKYRQWLKFDVNRCAIQASDKFESQNIILSQFVFGNVCRRVVRILSCCLVRLLEKIRELLLTTNRLGPCRLDFYSLLHRGTIWQLTSTTRFHSSHGRCLW